MSEKEWSEELDLEAKTVLTYLYDVFESVRDNIADLEEAIELENVKLCKEILDSVNEV